MNPKLRDICVLDLETTGLDPQTNEIIEMGAILNGKEFEVKIKPKRIDNADEGALEINGYNEKDWEDAIDSHDAFADLYDFAKGTKLMAYNVTFDWSFLRLHPYFINDIFRYHRLDIMTLAWAHLPVGSSISLKNVCKALDIEPEPETHRAINGARCAYQVLDKLLNI